MCEMQVKIEIFKEKFGWFLRYTDENGVIKFSEGLASDEALGVTAQILMKGVPKIPMYLKTAHQEVDWRYSLTRRRS